MTRLHDHERGQATDYTTLYQAIREAKQRWPGCLIVFGESETIEGCPACVYLDEEDMADRDAVGELEISGPL